MNEQLHIFTATDPALLPVIKETYRTMAEKRARYFKEVGMVTCPVLGCTTQIPRAEMKMTWWRKKPAAVCPDCYNRLIETRYIKDAYENQYA